MLEKVDHHLICHAHLAFLHQTLFNVPDSQTPSKPDCTPGCQPVTFDRNANGVADTDGGKIQGKSAHEASHEAIADVISQPNSGNHT